MKPLAILCGLLAAGPALAHVGTQPHLHPHDGAGWLAVTGALAILALLAGAAALRARVRGRARSRGRR